MGATSGRAGEQGAQPGVLEIGEPPPSLASPSSPSTPPIPPQAPASGNYIPAPRLLPPPHARRPEPAPL